MGTWLQLVLGLLAAAAPGLAQDLSSCAGPPRPAATLLFPYFELELDTPGGRTTLLAMQNTGETGALAHVVLWTDWGIPTLTFDVYLAKDQIQTLNVRDLFAGHLPVTGLEHDIASCSTPLTLPVLDAARLQQLRSQHTGQPSPEDGLCSGSGNEGAGVAVGYVTVDAMNHCSTELEYPFQPGYFEAGGVGLASNQNVLTGDYVFLDGNQNAAQGLSAVHIPAAAEHGPTTFYAGLLSGGADDRRPLPEVYRSRYVAGGPFSGGTDFMLWLEPEAFGLSPLPCGERDSYVNTCNFTDVELFDEAGESWAVVALPDPSLVTQRRHFEPGGVAASFGFFEVRSFLWSGCVLLPPPPLPRQSWLSTVMTAEGRFGVGLEGIPQSCAGAP